MTAGAIAGGALAGAGGTALARLAPAFIPEVAATVGGASISSGPGTILTAAGAAVGKYLQRSPSK